MSDYGMPKEKGTNKGGGAPDGGSSTDSDSSNVSLAAKKVGAKDGYSSAGDTSNSDADSEPDGLPLPASQHRDWYTISSPCIV